MVAEFYSILVCERKFTILGATGPIDTLETRGDTSIKHQPAALLHRRNST